MSKAAERAAAKAATKNAAPPAWHHAECPLALGYRLFETPDLTEAETQCSCPPRWPRAPKVPKERRAAKPRRSTAQRWHHESCPLSDPAQGLALCACPEGWPQGRATSLRRSDGPAQTAERPNGRIANPCLGALREPTTVATEHFALRMDFTPSNARLTAYCELKGYRMALNWDTETGVPAPTFDDNALDTLRERYPKDPLFPLVARYRQVEKAKGIVDGLPVRVGRVHTELNHLPRTGRLASRNPNLQNVPRFSDADSPYFKIREMFVAAPGHRLMEFDFGGIEAVLTMYLAGVDRLGHAKPGCDDAREGLRLTGIDIHGFLSSHDIGQPADLKWSDADLRDYLKAFRKENRQWKTKSGLYRPYEDIRDANKMGLYGSLYMGGPPTLVRAYPNFFPNDAVAGAVQGLIFDLFPSVKKLWWEVCQEADTHGYLTTPDGYRQWFAEVLTNEYLKREDRWEVRMSRLANEAIAAKPQHLAMCYTAQGLAEFWERYPQWGDGLRLTIHDSIVGEWADGDCVAVAAALKGCMETPLPFLPLPAEWGMGSHLKVAAEGKWSAVGGHWREMKKIV